ncbi:Hek2p ASCRUDRAFT_37205 [Ascoidea rubescens DSM 1968]|uniref:K Homology domain-containing protein n=1 Tax=Ascoidea rubescens DSM 1968 TaxID=1344418 RepID=A0A1D2VDL0_9ASCO|nr:hypothetical protein ASCRUDRAFT_37205 [Ascoidea rubescens DSM 1968]ODV59689.1 hypothetical protein ASCRUDRAFT_37205 [Ascoidea rubescens DSM 1968]
MQIDAAVLASMISFRILITFKEAGIIIGTRGECVENIRTKTNVKAGISKLVPGSIDRILTISGQVNNVCDSLQLFAQALLDSQDNSINSTAKSFSSGSNNNYFPIKPLCPQPNPKGSITLRLMIPHSQMGSLIGKQGLRIKELQKKFSILTIASKDFLPNSTERVVEIQGTPQNINLACQLISKHLIADWHNATGTLYYIPHSRPHNNNYAHNNHNNHNSHNYNVSNQSASNSSSSSDSTITQTIEFPSDIVGCLIGKKGIKIKEIRNKSNCVINIAEKDSKSNQRLFKLIGNQYNIDKALSLLYTQIEKEKARRNINNENNNNDTLEINENINLEIDHDNYDDNNKISTNSNIPDTSNILNDIDTSDSFINNSSKLTINDN